MSNPRVLSQIEIVDTVLKNLRSIGHEPDLESIQFVWKIVNKQVTHHEITAWKEAIVKDMRRERDLEYGRMQVDDAFWRSVLLTTSATVSGLTDKIEKACMEVSATLAMAGEGEDAPHESNDPP